MKEQWFVELDDKINELIDTITYCPCEEPHGCVDCAPLVIMAYAMYGLIRRIDPLKFALLQREQAHE